MRKSGTLTRYHKDSSIAYRVITRTARLAAAFAAFLGGCLWSGAANADAVYDACLARTSTSFDFSQCGKAWIGREEAALEVAWRKAYSQLSSPQAKARLLQEQRLWISYKDASCGFLGTDEFGSMGWSEKLPECRATVIRARIEQLSNYAQATQP